MVVGARQKVVGGVDDVFVPASKNRLVVMFQVVWWCWWCCFKLFVMWMCLCRPPRGGAGVCTGLVCCGVALL